MKKNRTKRSSHAKKRSILLVFVGILGLAMILLGGAIGYKIFQKYTFDETIQTIKNEKDQLFNEGSQKESFKKGQAEIIVYYPLQGNELIPSIKDKINQDIKDNLEDKDNLVFYYTEKLDSVLKGIITHSVSKQIYDLSNSKVEETEKTSLGKVYLTEDGKLFTLDQLFSDSSKAKEILLKELTSFLKDKKLEQAKIDQLVLTDSEPKQLYHLLETSKAFNIGEILVTEETLSKREFMDKIKESNLKVRPIKTGEQLVIFGSSLEVIENQNRDSKASIAMYGKLLNQTFLVTGNIEEKFLNKSYSKIQADVVLTHQQATKKKTDVQVFEIFQPKITVISVDKKKKFKEKNGEINQELGNSIYKTDQKGAIRFKGWSAWQIETVR